MLRALLLDLDGVVYHGRVPVPGAVELIRRWRGRGIGIRYITNRSGRTPEAVAAHLAALGVPCDPGEVLTSALATALHLGPCRAFVIGEQGLVEVLGRHGIAVTDTDPAYVIVGGDSTVDYAKLTRAVRLVLAGAKLIATNPDRLVNTETGVVPGNGSIVAAIAYATRAEPTVIGKPEPTLVELALEQLGAARDEALLVGDNLETDIEAGRRAGVRTVHLLTGISREGDRPAGAPEPTWTAADFEELGELVARLAAPIPADPG
jgi:HAD superfamily hydrolase (TIGR01457 family)